MRRGVPLLIFRLALLFYVRKVLGGIGAKNDQTRPPNDPGGSLRREVQEGLSDAGLL